MSVDVNVRLYDNRTRAQTFQTSRPAEDGPLAFHQRLDGYRPTPLVRADTIAQVLGVASVWVKDESDRFGLPSFKILGASWAVCRVLVERLGATDPTPSLDDLRRRLDELGPLCLVAASDGNHGRAVARMAAQLSLEAHIFVPQGTAEARTAAIRSEGAVVTTVDGDYDDAVRESAESSDRRLVISDTAWPGYERVPRWIIEGYATIHQEVAGQLASACGQEPDVVAVQMGVGAFAASVVEHYRTPSAMKHVALVGVEPLDADCLRASMVARQLTSVPGPHTSIMAGLNCGTPSMVAWPLVSGGVDLFAAIDDEASCEAMRLLAREGIVAGESGAAGLAGLIRLHERNQAAVSLDSSACLLVFSTEDATDPRRYEAIVGQTAEAVSQMRVGE